MPITDASDVEANELDRASRSVRGSSSEPGSVGRAGLTVAGLPLLCARYITLYTAVMSFEILFLQG